MNRTARIIALSLSLALWPATLHGRCTGSWIDSPQKQAARQPVVASTKPANTRRSYSTDSTRGTQSTVPDHTRSPRSGNRNASFTTTLSEMEARLEEGKSGPEILEALAEIVEADPRNARAHYLLGRAFDLAGYKQLAAEHYDTADSLDPSAPDALLKLFEQKLDQDDRVGAYKLLDYLARRFPQEPSVLYMQGLFAYSQGNENLAERRLKQAMESPRGLVGTRSLVAALRINQKRYTEALALADQDLSIKPDHFYGNLMKGQALYCMHRTAEALPYLKHAYETRPDHKGTAEILSRAYQRQGWYVDALEPALYELGLATVPSDMERLKGRVGYLARFVDAQKLTNVSEMARRRIGDAPEGPRIHFALGDVLDRLGRRNEAVGQYARGLMEDPSLARGWYRLARDLERIGEFELALQSYTRALETAPDDMQITLAALRFSNRLKNSGRDIAWQIKQFLRLRQATVPGA